MYSLSSSSTAASICLLSNSSFLLYYNEVKIHESFKSILLLMPTFSILLVLEFFALQSMAAPIMLISAILWHTFDNLQDDLCSSLQLSPLPSRPPFSKKLTRARLIFLFPPNWWPVGAVRWARSKN